MCTRLVPAEHLEVDVEIGVRRLPFVDDGARHVVCVVDEDHGLPADPEVSRIVGVGSVDVCKIRVDLINAWIAAALWFVVEGPFEAGSQAVGDGEKPRDP